MTAAVIFDCDGVLVDSEPAAFALLAEDLARHGLPMDHDEMEAHFLGGTIPGAAVKARALGADLPADWVHDFYERLYARLALGTPLMPHVLTVVEALDAAGIPYAVGSNGSERKMQVTLGQHPKLMARLKGRLFSGQTLGAPKPAPDLYLHAARELGVEPRRCTVIEDSPTGARAARAAGMVCFGYAPNGRAEALAAEGALPFSDMRELPRLLGL
ncbi:HAD-IA family hydrolase [Cereibacter sphaeroides]|uniref:HAD family hydrolase n=1 Tax=Cereibacter sphaeroides TaxID=1063 RepID=UPI001F1ECD8D|nr:HAD-IA family hydrolase [Cereibacter sphaeroides]MCE6959939.1 HAD-IA family hydrolase [Cereibacter sphaeroides]MCE6968508.1 HAD-IA family hydrolase [Cereibacter sphaeroides]MCE6973024.1 HAD-IA family hydrolase [Cereibacter sphaeroides]